MTWEEKIKMAKDADPSLTEEAAAEVVREIEQFAHFALEQYEAMNVKTYAAG